jgi:hypothetical protein
MKFSRPCSTAEKLAKVSSHQDLQARLAHQFNIHSAEAHGGQKPGLRSAEGWPVQRYFVDLPPELRDEIVGGPCTRWVERGE